VKIMYLIDMLIEDINMGIEDSGVGDTMLKK
jgi:hypothetical protein